MQRAMNKTAKITWVVAAALIDEAGQVLMQRRKLSSDNGGLWEFPGGKVENDESFQQSLRREIAEELGVYLAENGISPVAFSASQDEPMIILLFLCREWTGRPLCLDGEEIAWFEPEALQDLAMSPLDVPLARALLDLVKR